ncbi:hypothetical protein [Anaerotignum sp.]|uniref:hypothetical protein n=1 Tax=Anaerotignum sp. TaxID=2039241 RepID=UPI003995D9B3
MVPPLLRPKGRHSKPLTQAYALTYFSFRQRAVVLTRKDCFGNVLREIFHQ